MSGPLPGVDLFVSIDRRDGLRASLERALRDAIADGRLRAGTRLPPTRVLAQDLGVSRGTVLEAYTQLASGGWILGRQGSGTVVAEIGVPESELASEDAPQEIAWRYDLREGRPDPTSFPRAAWLRALRRALTEAPPDALGLGDSRGRPELHEQLAAYLARARGLRVRPEQIIVTTGFMQGLNLVARALGAEGIGSLAMEDPCLGFHRDAVAGAGQAIVPLPIDDDGAQVERLSRETRAVLLTPNRQHPLGMPLAPARRALLAEWARGCDGVVIEDDYDGEFRYDGRPIGALQGLEPSRVIYAGTASKTLAAGIRLGWLVLPPDLIEPVLGQKRLLDWQTGALEQLALAELIRSGEYDRHIRKMRLHYRRRRDLLVRSLRRHVPERSIAGTSAGLNLFLRTPSVKAERELLEAAEQRRIRINGLTSNGYPHDPSDRSRAGLIIGYAASPEHAYPAAVGQLVKAISG
jgi:GntR family transcriptional regulator/MocR family aminotransferase